MGRRQLPVTPIKTEYIDFVGGFDSDTPPLKLSGGFVRVAQNFEQDVNGGYITHRGYERYNGRTSPSSGVYAILDRTSGSTTPTLYELITGGTSGATGRYLGLTADGDYILTATTGAFVTEAVTGSVSGALGNVAGPTSGAAATQLLHAQYTNLAADYYRTLISAVTGSGDVVGIAVLSDIVYAFRNNVGGTAVEIYKSSATGWQNVPLGEEVYFSNANTSVGEGDTLTQGGVTATIARVVVQTGTLASGTNTGKLIITGRAGGNYGAGAATSTGGGALTLTGIQTAITLAANGRYEFIVHSFTGQSSAKRIYGVNGVSRGFEFDGTTLVPIDTAMSPDTPTHVIEHRNHLFFSFRGSAQHSAPGFPYVWSPIVGAAELVMGDDITGFMVQAGGEAAAALSVICRNEMATLYGTGVINWNLVPMDQEAGGIAYTIQRIGPTVMLDDRGLTTLQSSQAYGNFQFGTLSKRIHSWLRTRRPLAQASCVVRDKNQYRLFFSDLSAIYVTMEGSKVVGAMPQVLAHEVTSIWSGELSNGTEATYFGSTDGHVYQMERGTSFDGANIECFIELAWSHFGTPRQEKGWKQATFEVAGEGYAAFFFSYQLAYGSSRKTQPLPREYVASMQAEFWDSFTWDSFFWDGRPLLPMECDMKGSSENVSLRMASNSDYYTPLRFSGSIVAYEPRRQLLG